MGTVPPTGAVLSALSIRGFAGLIGGPVVNGTIRARPAGGRARIVL